MSKKLKYFQIVRTIKEYFEVQAENKERAKEIVGMDGGPHEVRIISETVKQVKYKEDGK